MLRATYSRLHRYGIAVSAVALVLFLMLLEPAINVKCSPFMLCFAAVIVSAWYGSLGPGLLATALASLTCAYFFVPPIYSLTLASDDIVGLGLFMLEGGLLSSLMAQLHIAKQHAEVSKLEPKLQLQAEANEQLCTSAEQKQIEEERTQQRLAREQEARVAAEVAGQRFLDLVQGLDAIVTEADAETWKFSFVSQPAEAILGYPVERWLSEPDFFIKMVHPDDLEEIVTLCRAATAQGRDHEFEYRALAADGRVVWLRDFIRVILDDEGRARQLLGVMVNITEQKQMESALQQAHAELEIRVAERTNELRNINDQLRFEIAERQQVEEELREKSLALENAMEGISQLDTQGHYITVNRAYANMVGYQPEEMLGMEWQLTVHPEDRAKMMAVYQSMLTNGKVEAEVRGICKDGSIFYKQLTMISAYDKRQVFTGHYCFIKNITERKRSQELLLKQSRLAALEAEVGVLLTRSNTLRGV